MTTLYCGTCGERALDGISPTVDGTPSRSFLARLLASLRALAAPPGRLTADWVRGRRVGYLAPLSLFLWVNVAFFLIQSASGLGILAWPLRAHLSDDMIASFTGWLLALHRPDMAVPTAAYADVFNALESVHAKSLVIVMIPALAVALSVLLLDRRKRFKDTLTFATHFFTFALIWLCALFPLASVALRGIALGGVHPLPRVADLVITALEVALLAWYLFVALGTVYGLAWWRRALTVIVLVFALHAILKAYHVIVFTTTLYSI